MSTVDVFLKLYGIKKDELLEWGKKNYPELGGNLRLLLAAYIREVLGQEPPVEIFELVPKVTVKKVIDLKEDEWSVIEVYVARVVSERTYTACPICFRKLTNGECTEHGKQEPIEAKFVDVVVGDDTAEVVATLTPRVTTRLGDIDIVGCYVRMRGRLTSDMRFVVSEVTILKMPKTRREVSVEEVREERFEEVPKIEVEEKPQEEIPEGVLNTFRKLIETFEEVSLPELEKWARRRGFKGDVVEVVKRLGYVIEDGVVKMRKGTLS